MRRDFQRDHEALRILWAHLEAIARAGAAADLLRGEGAAIVHVEVFGDAVGLNHVADDEPHHFPRLGLIQAPCEDLVRVEVLDADEIQAHRLITPGHAHEKVQLVTVHVDGLHGMEAGAAAALGWIERLCAFPAFAGHHLHRLRHLGFQPPTQCPLGRDRRPAVQFRCFLHPPEAGRKARGLRAQIVGFQEVPCVGWQSAFCLTRPFIVAVVGASAGSQSAGSSPSVARRQL